MDLSRVGVLSDDPTLVVSLGLRCSSLWFVPVMTPEEVAGHDLALVDLRGSEETAAALAQVSPPTPVVAVIGEHAEAPAGVVVVRRPCSLDQVTTALLGARDGTARPEVIVLDDPVGAVAAPPLFAARTTPAAGGAAPAGGVATSVSVGPGVAGRLARQLREIHALARPLATSTVVTAALAEELAQSLCEVHAAEHVSLWNRSGDDLVLLGEAGGAWPEHAPFGADHPLVGEATRQSDGLARCILGGVGGRLGCVLVDDDGPVDVVAVAGPDVTEDVLVDLRAIVVGAEEPAAG